jgi:hypothetical protein
MLNERNRLRVGVASVVRRSEGEGWITPVGQWSLLESFGGRVDFLILRSNLWQQERTVLPDWGPGWGGHLSVDRVR